MKKMTIILGSLLALTLASCGSKEGKDGLLTLKDKQAYEFDQMYSNLSISCTKQYLEMRNLSLDNLDPECKKAYADLENQIKDKFSISNVSANDIDQAYPTIQQEANKYANSHVDEVLNTTNNQASKDFFSTK